MHLHILDMFAPKSKNLELNLNKSQTFIIYM